MNQHAHRPNHSHGDAPERPVGLRRHRVLFAALVVLALLALGVFVITNFESLLPASDVPADAR